jgi:hypothetical protein
MRSISKMTLTAIAMLAIGYTATAQGGGPGNGKAKTKTYNKATVAAKQTAQHKPEGVGTTAGGKTEAKAAQKQQAASKEMPKANKLK